MSYHFSSSSLRELSTCEDDLSRLFQKVISQSPVDFCIDEGARSLEKARKNFQNGKSQDDPDKGQISKHCVGGPPVNRSKSRALDLFPIIDGKRQWSNEACEQIAECVREVSENMDIKIRWGGSWKGWDYPNKPGQFMDLGHFELY